MRFFSWWRGIFSQTFGGNTVLTIVFSLGLTLLLVSGLTGRCLRNTGLCAALSTLVVSVLWLVLAICGVSFSVGMSLVAILAAIGGFVYLLLTISLSLQERAIKRKLAREQIERRLQFTLPQKDNTFIRERLNTVLKVPQKDVDKENTLEQLDDGIGATENFRLSHARTLLAKLREASLSTADRLETEEMSRLLAAYMKKSRLTADDLRAINDTFSGIVKLSAKYSV